MEDRRIHVMIDGEQQDLSLDKWNKNGGATSFAKEFPNAEVRMRDNAGQDYSVPISQFSSAAQKGLHMFTYSTTPDRTKPIMSGIKNDILARPIDNFAKTAFNRTIQQPKKLAEKEIEPIHVNTSKPITTQLPNATLYNVQQDADKEFDTSIAPKIDKLYSQQIQRGNAAAEQFDATHIAPPEAGIGMGLAKSKAISDATDAGDIVTNIRDYISSKQKSDKGTGIDPRTDRIMSRTIDYLAKKQMPKSTIEYILRNMYDNSLIGSVANLGLSKSSEQQQVQEKANEKYNPSKATKIASGVGSLLLDSPLFGAGGKLASGITKLGVKGAQRIIADKLIEASGKTLAKDVAMQQAARVMASNTPKAVFGRIAQGMSDTALNLGGYDATSDIVGQTNAINSGQQDKFNVGQTAKRGLWGAATGAASGILGGTVGHLSRNLSGAGKALSDLGGYVGDSSVFAGMSALQKYANGEPIDLTEDAIDSFATLGAMKIGHIGSAIRNWSKASAEERKQMQDALNFTPEDKESLSKYGIDGNDLIGTIGKLSHQTTETHAVPGKILTENGRYIVRDAGKEETKKVEKDFDTIMKAPDIPISTKNKVLYMVKGRQVVTPMTSYNISKNGDKARLTTYDWAGRPILVKDFKTDKDAKQYASRNDYDNNILRNTASVLENINDKNINYNYKKIIADNISNAVNGGNYADLSEGEKRVVDSYNNQLGEAMKASVDEIKRSSGIDVESLLNTPRELLTPQQADAVDKYNKDFNSYKKDNDIRNDIKEALNPEYNTFDDTKPHSPVERTRDKRIIEIRKAIDEARLGNDKYLDNMSSSIRNKVKEDTGIDINKALESKTRTKEEDDAVGTYIEALKKNIGADTKEEPDMETQKYIIADNFSKATENVTDIDPNNPKPEDEQKIKDYDNAKQQFGNYVEYVNNKAKQAADEAENWAKELSNKKMNGLIVTATTPLSENPIYIVDGRIVHKEDGSIDYDKSDPEIIYVDPNNGKRKRASLQNADGNFITDVNYDNYDTYVKSVRQQAEDKVRAKEQQDFDNRDQMSEELPKNEVSPTEEIEQNVSEQPNTQEQIRPVPLDENGKPVYHKAPIESTLKDMRDKGADDDTISEFAQMRVDALTKEQSKLDKQKPAPSDDFSVFQQNKAALQSQKKDVSDQLDYWNSVYNSLQQTEQPVEPSTGQQPSEQVEPQTVQPIEQQPNMSTQHNTEQQPIESAPTKTIKVRNRPLGPKRYYTKESKEMGAPTSLREAVMRAIAEGDYKFQWKDNTSDKTKGLGSHLGYGEKERKQMIGFTASKENGGMPPEVVAEKIKGELGEQFPNATDQDIFDEILDIFGTYGGSRKAIWNAAKEQHGVDQNAEEEEYYRGQLEAEAYYNHMSPEEYEAYEYDYIPSYLEEIYNSETDDDINERLSTFADIINSENNENNSEGTSTVYGQLPERKGLQPGTEGSDSVLPESGSIQYGNDSESNEIRENSTDKADEVGNDDVHGQFVPATDEGIKASREFDIKLQNAKLALENAQKEYDKKLKSINDRNGLFGDTKDDGTSMFGDTSDFSKGTVDKSLEPYKAKIEAAKRDIDKLNESRDAFIKQQETQKNISQEEKNVDTNPTEAQKEAGNYKKGHVNIDGMNFTIENPKGSTRSGKDSDGEEWHTVMNNTYGYIKGTKGIDGDHIDMYLSDNPTEGKVYVIDQINPKTGEFDEHKVMYGFNSALSAKRAYLSNYSKGWAGLGKITEVSKDEFKKWIDSSTRKTKPFSEYKSVKDEPLETTNEKRMSEIVEELSDVESRMMELEDNDLTDSSEYGNLKAKMGDLESEYKGLKTINEESNRIQNGINEPSPTYKTGSGKKITFTPIQYNLFTNNAPIKNSRDTLSGPHLDELKPGDICNVERVFSKTKSFEFYGNNKIESYEDVAYIFKNLEDEAIEHSFMVYIKNGKATVLHMCMGDFSAVMTNPAAGKYADHIIDSDEVYFVHNHPSGNLKPSAQDMKVNARMKELFGKKLKDSIIIDRKSGKFAIFDEYSSGVLDEKNNINKKEPVEVYEFNKLSFGSDSIPPTKISSSYDVAEFVSTQRLGDRKKINYLIISQAGEITADIQTPFIDFKNTKKIGDDIINKVAQFGGTQAIIYGDFELENSTPIKSINGYIQNAGVRLCDVIKIDGNNTKYDLRFKSAMDEGMAFDPNQVKPTVNNEDVRFRNSSQLDAQYPISNARNKRIVTAAENLSNSLHTELNIVHSNELDGKKSKAKAWYDVKEDKVYLVPENNIDEADAEQSILHEVVVHKGLRKMFGEDFDNAMWDIYKSVPEEERKKIAKEASDRYDNDFVKATEEYLASMAEKGVDKPSLWKRIVSRIRELLRKVGIKLKMSDNDIKYLLWKSRRGMEKDISKEFEVKENIFGNVEHAPLEPLFRIDPKDLNGKDMQQQVELAKTVAELNEQEVGDYLERMKHQVLFEAWIDKTNPIRVLQDTIMKHYKENIPDDCDAHLAYNVMTSRAHNEKSMFQKQIYEPLIESVKKIGKYDDVMNYLIAKHGMERNALMRSKEIEALKESFEKAEKDIDSDSFKKAAEKIRYKDFSGLTGLQRELKYKETDKWEDDLSKVVLSDDYIQSFIDSFEENKDEADLAEMWALINIATDFSLETQKKYGCISQDKLDEISSMYEFYVPLRDWSDPRAEDFFDYLNTEKYEGLNMPLKKAFGRKSKAGDPIANIASMADSAIVTGNKNRVRQHLFRLVFNYPTNLAHISPVWYTEDEVSGETKEVVFEPKEGVDYDSAFEEFKTHMDELEKNGIINKAYPRLAVGKPIKKWQATQHSVRVKINGDDYIVYMDSSPRAAQAINGENVISSVEGLTWMKNIQNFMARNFTSRMLNFVFRNFFRDYTGALTYNYVYKYGSMLDFVKSTPQAARTLAEYLLTGSMSDGKYGTYLKEFLENGGETGYGNSMSYNDFVKDIKKDINTAKHPNRIQMFRWMARGLDILNRGAEDTTRFTAYISSREGGKSVMQSIKAAKEISVNFNRAGSGDKCNAVARIWYMFLNAGIQALYNTVRAFKNNPVRASLAFGTWAGIGFLNGVMQYYMTGDNDYFDIPDWVRQNNLAIKVGQTTMVSLPLALEIRPFFAIGDILAQATFGKYHGKNAATDIATKFMESAPYNFFEGTNERDDSSIELLANTAAPSALKPFFDVFMTNRDYTGKPISKQNEFNRYVPEYKKGYKSTSDIAIRLSKLINDISGGDNARKGYLDNRFNNPAVLEYLFNNYGGGVMKQIFSSAKSAVNAFGDGKEVDVRDIPVASAVIYNFDSSKNNTNINQMYYNYINDMEESKSQDREYLKDAPKDPSSIKGYVNKKSDIENEKKVAIISFYKSIIGNLSEERKMVPDDSETAKNIDSNIFKLKKAMVEQLEKY